MISVDFERGDPVAIDGARLSPAAVLTKLNELGKANGIGRLDLVENRFVGMKSRGVYETPGGTILLAAHRGMESITLDREAAHLKDQLMPRYAELIYNGFWFSPERRMLQALIDESQKSVSGRVRLKLYKGNVSVIGRELPNSLYSMRVVTFEEDQGAYNQFDAQGFIKLNALRLRLGRFGGAARRGAVAARAAGQRRPVHSEGDRADRADPAANLGVVGIVHVEEVRHHRLHRRLAAIIRRHRDDAAEHLERSAIQVLHNIVPRGEAGIDEGAQVLPDRLASVPVGDTEIADGVVGEAVETLAEGLVVDLLPEIEQPARRRGLGEGFADHGVSHGWVPCRGGMARGGLAS